MIHWDSHMCLPLHRQASFEPIDQLRAAGLNYVSINVGMDMNPVSQIISVIAGYRATIAADPHKYVLASSVADIEWTRATGQIAIGFDLEGAPPDSSPARFSSRHPSEHHSRPTAAARAAGRCVAAPSRPRCDRVFA